MLSLNLLLNLFIMVERMDGLNEKLIVLSYLINKKKQKLQIDILYKVFKINKIISEMI